jgi:predicted outer membrane repeat protein
MRIWGGVAAAVLLALMGAHEAAAATTFTVTRLDDPAPNGCMPMDCSLREAVLDANFAAGADVISLPAGHFRLSIPGANEDGGATGDLDVTDDVTITGAGARVTTIDAQGIDRVLDGGPGTHIVLRDLAVTGGQSTGNGGGIRSSALTLDRDSITGNTSLGNGGGVASSTTLSVLSSTVSGNQATGNGGGIEAGANIDVEDSTIAGNVAGGLAGAGDGGGIDAAGAPYFSLASSTVADNQAFNGAVLGGGIRADPSALVDNTILANNVAHSTDQSVTAVANCDGSVQTQGHNLSDGTDCGFVNASDQQGVPVLLGPLADNGGPTNTEALLTGSRAVDKGAGCATADQRGVTRPRGAACDIGAYELAAPLATTTAATSAGFTTATLTGTVDPSLRETTAWFIWGPTVQYGYTTPVRGVGSGNGALVFTEPLAGLRQGQTYHYRLVAENSEGHSEGADQSFTTLDRQKPVLTVLRIIPGLFHRRNGAAFSFTLSETATVTFRFDHTLRGVRSGKRCVKITRRNRRHRPCTRYLPVAGSVVLSNAAEGKNSMHFDATVNQKLLAFGAYRLRATPRDPSGNIGKTVLGAFRVLR